MFYGTVNYEAKRLAVLEGYEVLDTEPEANFDELAAVAAHVCETPIALIAFISRDRQWFKATHGMAKGELPRAVSFCHYTIQGTEPLIVHDTCEDARFKDNPLVVADPKFRFYAGVPLQSPEGYAIGTICVLDYKPRMLRSSQIDSLRALGNQVFSQLELRKLLKAEQKMKMDLEKRVRQRTADLARSVLEAHSASRMKSTFLANMSHEIRTPLSAIMGYADLMKDSSLSKDERRLYLDIITRNGELLQTVINDILDLSKIEAGHFTIEKLKFSPRAVTEDVVALLQMQAESKGLWLRCNFDKRVPDSVVTDPIRLKQILTNILGNAIKFTAKGGVSINVSYDATDPQNRQVRFEVTDTGPGISPPQQERLFKAFSQADESMSRKHGGTGLGLSLSQRLAQLLEGDVVLKWSRLNEGSSFVVSIKDHVYEAVSKGQDAHYTGTSHPIEPDALKSTKVLVVDDSLDNQRLIERILKKYGATIEVASNGIEGVDKALSGQHDIVLMDLQMPILDGYSAIKRLRARQYSKPILALTAHALPENRRKCIDLGCSDYLSKPIHPKDLVASILKNRVSCTA